MSQEHANGQSVTHIPAAALPGVLLSAVAPSTLASPRQGAFIFVPLAMRDRLWRIRPGLLVKRCAILN